MIKIKEKCPKIKEKCPKCGGKIIKNGDIEVCYECHVKIARYESSGLPTVWTKDDAKDASYWKIYGG